MMLVDLVIWLRDDLKMIEHGNINQRQLFGLLKTGSITFAGNAKLKIYGRLQCVSGKRMEKENRIFFMNEAEATANGYRPCGHCMREQYSEWKRESTF
jgi:hypothetical protein